MTDARLELDMLGLENPLTVAQGTLLDHFAGLAMQTIIHQNPTWLHLDAAKEAYKQAWAMLKVRSDLKL